MIVVYAKMRPATDQELYQAEEGWARKIICAPSRLLTTAICTAKMWWFATNGLEWYKPAPLEFLDKLSGRIRLWPECSILSYFPTIFGNNYQIEDPLVIKAAFEWFRGGPDHHGILTPTRSIKLFHTVIVETFGTHITEEDLLFTCSFKNYEKYHLYLKNLLNKQHIDQYRPSMRLAMEERLESWARRCSQGEQINATSETRYLASQMITTLLFSQSLGGEELADAVNFISWYILHSQIRRLSVIEKEKYNKALQTFRNAVNDALASSDIVPLFAAQGTTELTLAQKQAMAFVIFFAGQETVSFFLLNLLRMLAQDTSLQTTLRKELQIHTTLTEQTPISSFKGIQALIAQALAEAPPAYAITRRIGFEDSSCDVCLEYQLAGEVEKRKFIIYKGDRITLRMIKAAERLLTAKKESGSTEEILSYHQWSPFGGTMHHCPGERLALAEAQEFLQILLKNYELRMTQNTPSMVGWITLQFEQDIHISIRKLEASV